MSACGWLIMAVRTCNPFQWETNAATVLSSPKRSGPRATSPPAWSQYLSHREGTLGSGDVWTHCNLLQTWWDEQKRWISTKLHGTLYLFCTSFLYLAVNSWGRWHDCRSNWWNINGSSYKKQNKHTFWAAGSFKAACEWISDDRGAFALTLLLAAALVSELHVTFRHGCKQLI